MSRKSKKAQKLVLDEIQKQLILQAERWGRADHYTPIKLEEMEVEQCYKILGDLYAEKANLEYELHILGTDKHEVLIKIERLNVYIKRALSIVQKHENKIRKIIGKSHGDVSNISRALANKSGVSILISEN